MSKLVLNFRLKSSKRIKYPKNLLGGKGANLAEMRKLGLPVPPGFTISTKACDLFFNNNKKLNPKILKEIKKELKIVEKQSEKKIWRFEKSFISFSKIWRKSINARNDGYNS